MDRDAKLGRQVVQPQQRYIIFDHTDKTGFDVAGLGASFSPNRPPGNSHTVRELARLARHVPNENGHMVEFVDLANRSRGTPMLGVLKADADSLGAAIAHCLNDADDLKPLRKLSDRLENFFASKLNQQMTEKNSPWSNLYTVFSGGDDLLLVGPWNIVLDFAAHLRHLFTSEFTKDQLTISAGAALVKPRFPIHLAAQQAEKLLHQEIGRAHV